MTIIDSPGHTAAAVLAAADAAMYERKRRHKDRPAVDTSPPPNRGELTGGARQLTALHAPAV